MADPNLTRADARVRADLLTVDSYEVSLDLTDGAGAPGERVFRSRTTVRFGCSRPGESTFVDLIADRVRAATLNGEPVDTSGYAPERGIALTGLAAENELVVDADCLYTNTGEGLHRFTDPADGRVYLYTQFETSDAKRMYTCFDQPDLKATFTLRVTVPEDWTAVSNAAATRVEPVPDGGTVVTFGTTPRMSTYITALVAGPYHQVTDHHDGIDLGLYCRRSLAEFLDPDEIFDVTKSGFDWYHEHFGFRYPFGKYDQLFVPEFNAGAMENAGCVTISETALYRSKVTEASRERRADALLHEMAHMWFGDLVTMRWWDDLWLNESFASYAAVLSQSQVTRWTGAWTTFATVEKTWAYHQDQLPSTHPIAADTPDIEAVRANFDGITYAKGASVLKQLAAYVGVDAFLAGTRTYFQRHAFGNTELADLLRALEEASGRDLSHWSGQWLESAGVNTIRAEFDVDDADRFTSFALVQTAPEDHPTLRDHRLAIGLYGGSPLARIQRVELDASGGRTEVPELVGVTRPDLILVNDDDLAYTKIRLDPASLATITERIGEIAESLPRALCWMAAWDMVRDGEMAARDFVRLVLSGIGAETDIGLTQALLRQTATTVNQYADPAWAPTGRRMLADAAHDAMFAAEPGGDHQLAWTRAFAGAARTSEHLAVLRGLLDGTTTVPGLRVDTELRWSLLRALVAVGAAGDADIDAELARDRTDAGERHAIAARAARPVPEAKAEAWRSVMRDDSLPNAMQVAVISGFFHPDQGDLVRPYVDEYFDLIDEVWRSRTADTSQRLIVGMYPNLIEPSVVEATDRYLANGVSPALGRLLREQRADLVRALRARERDSES